MRRSLAAALVWLAAGCGEAPFASVASGTYECSAVVVTNTCGSPVPDHSMSVIVEGGDLLSVPAPDSSALANAPREPVWNPLQFGAQSDTYVYEGTTTANCDFITGASYEARLHASVVPGTNELTMDVTWAYTGISDCMFLDVTVDRCELEWQVDCALVP